MPFQAESSIMNVKHRQKSSSLDQSLRLRRVESEVLTDVMSLYSLLPIRALHRTPEFVEENKLDLTSLPACRSSSLSINFLKKYSGFSSGSARQKAKEKFLFYESKCLESNRIIKKLRQSPEKAFLQSVIFTAQRSIAQVLGPFRLEKLLDFSRWGPRTTSSCKMSSVSAAEKFAARPDVTPGFLSKARLCLPLYPSWTALLTDTEYGVIANPMFVLKEYNKITFVPKTSKIDRVIAVEPHVNTFFQNGLGRYMRDRIKRFAHVDLTDQTLNQRLAKLGSITNDLATIDLEGASDTICIELVRDLLPEDWFSWLDSSRSHFGKLDGEVIRYHKFSSMGNGATFDLESLIFWALSKAVTDLKGYNSYWCNVFGDDVIIPSGVYNDVVEVFEAVGFIVNKNKSFSDGPFRESCGKDYFYGESVRSVYLKDKPMSSVNWIRICNQLRLLSRDWGEDETCCKSFKPAYLFALSRIDTVHRHYRVPMGFTDNGIISNFDEATPSLDTRNRGWGGFYVKAIVTKANTKRISSRGLITAGCFQPSQVGNDLPIIDSVSYREENLYILNEWTDIGPWY